MFAVLSPARKVASRLAMIAAAAFLAACQPVSLGGTAPSAGQLIDPSAPVPVALLVPRGGGNAGDDQLAQALENAARLAITDLKGVKIDLRVYGTAGDPGTAQQAALQAVSDGARIILGPVYAQSANAVAVVMQPKNVNVLSFSNTTAIAGNNLFILGPTFDNSAQRLVDYAAKQGKKRITVVHSTDVPGQSGLAAIQKAIANSSATLAGTVAHPFSQEGVVAAVPQVVATVKANNADAVLMTANSAGALPLFAQMLPEAGLGPSVMQYIGLTRWDIPAQTLSLPGVQGGWFALPDPQMNAAFRSRYEAAFGAQPHPISGLAYDGIAAIGVLAKTGKPDALSRRSLTQSAGFQGTGGIFRLLADGTNQRGLAVAQIRNNQVVVIDPAPRSFGGAGF